MDSARRRFDQGPIVMFQLGQVFDDTDILFPDDQLDILELDDDELLFEARQLASRASLHLSDAGLRVRRR